MKHCNVETVLSILDIKEKSQANVREIARLTNCSKSTVADILKRCKDRGLVYTLLSQKAEEEVISLVFSPAGRKQTIAEPDWSTVFERIVKDPFLKLTDLFTEYHDKNPDGYKYSYFHEKYNTWVENNHPECLRIPATPVVSIDNAVGCWIGWFRNTVACLDLSGQHTYDESTDKLIVHKSDEPLRKVYIFFAVMGDSMLPFVEAFDQADQIRFQWGIKDSFAYFCGAPGKLITNSDQRAEKYNDMYDIEHNHGYFSLVNYLNITAYREPFSGNTEVCEMLKHVHIAVRDFLTGHTYHNIDEVNDDLALLMSNLADEKVGRIARKNVFRRKDFPRLTPVPEEYIPSFDTRYVTRVPNNYHIKIGGAYYSVPYTYYGEPVIVYRYQDKVSIWDTDGTLIHNYRRISKGYITTPDDMPTPEQRKAFKKNFLTGDFYRRKAAAIGKECYCFVELLLRSRPHEEQMYKTCEGIIRSAKEDVDKPAVNAACAKVISRSKNRTYGAFKEAMGKSRVHAS